MLNIVAIASGYTYMPVIPKSQPYIGCSLVADHELITVIVLGAILFGMKS